MSPDPRPGPGFDPDDVTSFTVRLVGGPEDGMVIVRPDLRQRLCFHSARIDPVDLIRTDDVRYPERAVANYDKVMVDGYPATGGDGSYRYEFVGYEQGGDPGGD